MKENTEPSNTDNPTQKIQIEDNENIQLSSNTEKDKPQFKPPSIQNLNNLILSCVKNDEYCYSMIDYLKKMIHIKQIDYYLAYTNLIYCFKPKEINETAKIRKHLKNKYARDDPGFLIILIINLLISSIAFSLAMKHTNPLSIFNIFFIQTFIMLFLFGLIIAFISKVIIDKFFKNDEMGSNKEETIEFAYAFDIHCNSFVPMYFFCAVIPFILLPITLGRKYYFQVIISNALLCFGVFYYGYVTFMGYFSLPFVRKNKFITLIIWPVFGTFFLITLLKFNIFEWFMYLLYAE